MSNDPVGFLEGGLGYFNRYAYVQNNPISAFDPTGMKCEGTGNDAACSIDRVNIGDNENPEWASRAEAVKSGAISEKKLSKLEGNITETYKAALALGEGSITLSGNKNLKIKDQKISGNEIANVFQGATLGVSTDKAKASARSNINNQSITFLPRSVGSGNFSQQKTTGHEGLHLIFTGWSRKYFQQQHQDPFDDAAKDLLKHRVK